MSPSAKPVILQNQEERTAYLRLMKQTRGVDYEDRLSEQS
jgi:hypothetical protein